MRKLVFYAAAVAICAAAGLPLTAQPFDSAQGRPVDSAQGRPVDSAQGRQAAAPMTAADYARAEKFMNYNVTPLVYRSGVRGNWLPDGRVWYRVTTETGSVATLVDPVTGTKMPCTLPECAASTASGQAAAGGRGGRGQTAGGGRGGARTDVPSPDGKRTAYIKDWNLWVRDVATGKETQLTTDGVKDFGYATDNAGW